MSVRVMLIIAAAVMTSTAGAADTMRCGSRLVSDGDPKAKVVDLCGRPTQTERRTVYRGGIPRQQSVTAVGQSASVGDRELLIHNRSLVEVEIDVWVYNRGRTRLMQEVVFQDNRVIEVNQLGRGY